MPFVVEQKK